MSAPLQQGQPATAASEVYCVLLPLAEERLLLPRACVLEVVNYHAPTPMVSAPPWYRGTIPWGGRQVPVVSFEACCGRSIPEPSGRTRIVLLHSLTADAAPIGILAQGFPQHVRVAADVLKGDDSRVFGERVPVICQVRMISEYPLIPDLERLEQMIGEETRVA